MQYVICYDISDDRRRDRVVSTLKDYGQRVEYSVFVANLDEELGAEMRERVKALLEPEDRAHVFVLCEACVKRTLTFGEASVPADPDYYVV